MDPFTSSQLYPMTNYNAEGGGGGNGLLSSRKERKVGIFLKNSSPPTLFSASGKEAERESLLDGHRGAALIRLDLMAKGIEGRSTTGQSLIAPTKRVSCTLH